MQKQTVLAAGEFDQKNNTRVRGRKVHYFIGGLGMFSNLPPSTKRGHRRAEARRLTKAS